MAILKSTRTPCPTDVLEWIAWYREPELSGEIRNRIDRHAAECLNCRSELEWILDEAAFDDGDPVAAPDIDTSLEKIMDRVREQIPASSQVRTGPWSSLRPALAAAATLALLLGAAWLAGDPAVQASSLRTAASAQTASAQSGQQAGPSLQVIFRDDASWEQIRDLVAEVDGRLVSGPTADGIGRVRLALRSDAARDDALRRLRASGLTLFAEPSI